MCVKKHELDCQFILGQNEQLKPYGWTIHENAPWILATHPRLPVVNIFDNCKVFIGWLIGYPITPQGKLLSKTVILRKNETENMDSFEKWIHDLSGRFACMASLGSICRFYLDSGGSLATVYSVENPVIASTISLIDKSENDWDHDLQKILGMPERDSWYPSGLTPCKSIKRLLPNHYLEMNTWTVLRHWPSPEDLAPQNSFNQTVGATISHLKKNINAVAERYPLQMSLTAGRDSRMLLACCKDILDKIKFTTGVWIPSAVDCQIAKLLSEKLKLKHVTLKVRLASDDQLEDWQFRTGSCVSGEIWRIHPTSRLIDAYRAFLPGCAGEVGRAYYWQEGDAKRRAFDAQEILKRAKLPPVGPILESTRTWLDEIAHLEWHTILDLMYIEQRLGCWAGPLQYGQDGMHALRLFPLNDRAIFREILRSPTKPRMKQMLAHDICLREWPELLDVPFNQLTGAARIVQTGREFMYLKAPENVRRLFNQIFAWRFQAC
jgi:hypothetical protein